MGDNIYLGDRDGVRTPMQWSLDRNGGFSRADPAKLFLPAIQDPVYGFSAVNVEAQLASPSSFRLGMRRIIAVRRSHVSFGRGSFALSLSVEPEVLVYLREFQNERILCVANVSRAPQAVELDLAEFKDAVPVELTAGSRFPAINSHSYLLTLPRYGFFWFRLEPADATKDARQPARGPGLFTLVATGKLETIFFGAGTRRLRAHVAPRFLPSRRWFGHKETSVAVSRSGIFAVASRWRAEPFYSAAPRRQTPGWRVERYFAPLAAEPEHKDGRLLATPLLGCGAAPDRPAL